jgi:hypothetical protein
MYLLIQNTGIAPIEAFTVLGVSTARGNAEKIGMFGSGGKHSVNILLRYGLNPIIFLGENELKFFYKPDFMGDKQYNRVCYTYKGQTERTGFSLEFGEMDWDSVEMTLREFISNAIDAVGVENVVLDIVDTPVAYNDSTSIYIPLTPEVQKYYNNLSSKFLHFVNKQDLEIFENNDGLAKIYRKGVFVREINQYNPPSMFNYNLGHNTKIDESRNMSDSSCIDYCSKILGTNKEYLIKYFKSLTDLSKKCWEDKFYYWCFDKDLVKEAWQEIYGNAVASDNEKIGSAAKDKGKLVVYVRNLELIKTLDLPVAENFITKVESSGYSIQDANSTTIKNFNKVWRKLEGIGLTMNKPKPILRNFTGVAQNGSVIRGYYDNGCVYINADDCGSFQTILEECAHYITGADDFSRDFQEFLTNVACRLVPSWNK